MKLMTEEQALLPGLPDDIALDCIARVPHRFLPGIRPVCRRWRNLVASPSFRRHRERIGAAEDLIFLIQALVPPGNSDPDAVAKDPIKPAAAAADLRSPVYGLSVCYPSDGSWIRIASPNPIPMFAQCVAVDGKLVVVGGWDPATLDPVPDVRILDLATGEWQRGRPMPADRSFFACAAVCGGVYVAGGHDSMKNALRTAEMYDLEADEWTTLPPMVDERDECRGVSAGGKFWAVSGYGTERQGRFEEAAERYDPASGEWIREEGVWSEEGTATACFAGGGREGLWCVGRRGVREYRGGGVWREAAPGPEGMKGSACAAAMSGEERVFVMGTGDAGGGWIWEIRSGRWTRVSAPAEFSGFAYSAAAARM